jgi:uncharacterized membrane protein required for colicin V production
MWYDVLAVGVLIFAVIRGAAKGIVWQLATIAALVLCFAFSGTLSLAIAPYITVKPPLNRWVAMFGLYVFFSFLSFAAARRLKSWIEKAQFVEYDRHLGSVFGFVKGVVFVLVMTFFGVTLTQQMPETRTSIFHSQTGRISAILMDRLHPVMPTELHAVLEPYIHSLDRPGLDLHAHHDEEGHDHSDHEHDGHSHNSDNLEPIEAPPFPQSPRRNDDDAPPFESVNNRPDDPGIPPEFESPFSLPKIPSVPETPSTFPTSNIKVDRKNLRAEREKLLTEVASVLAEEQSAQNTIMTEVENSLSGLPDEIKLAVVKDWYADLLIYDPNADPDKNTDLNTSFDARIVRQLTQKKVPLSSLSTALQERLRNTRQ